MVVLALKWLPLAFRRGKQVNDVDQLDARFRIEAPLGQRMRCSTGRTRWQLDRFAGASAAIAERLGVCPSAQFLSHAWL
jgi:hypothetical protein